MRTRPGLVLVALALAGTLLGGCGIPSEAGPRPVQPPPGPFLPTPSTDPGSTEPGAATETLYLVRGDALVRLDRHPDAPASVDAHLRHLLDGPTPAERAAGLTSALTGSDLVTGVRLSGTVATVELRADSDDAGRSDEVLAFGQLVCTLTSRRDVTAVTFVQRGRRLAVPRADGSLSQGPLTAADYANLIRPS